MYLKQNIVKLYYFYKLMCKKYILQNINTCAHGWVKILARL